MSNLVLKWAWRYHVLDVDEFETYEEARASAGWANDECSEALECIEVWDEQGYRKIDGGDVLDDWYAAQDAEDAVRAADRQANPPPPVIARLSLLAPNGGAVELGRYTDEARLQRDVERFRRLLGDRLVVT